MTLLITLELVSMFFIPPSFPLKVSETASSMLGTSAQLETYSTIRINDCLYGLMLPSGNDAAVTIA